MSLRLKLLLPLVMLAVLMGGYIGFLWAPRALAEAEQAHMKSVDLHLDSVVEGMIPLLLGNQLDLVYENLAALKNKNSDWTRLQLLHPGGRQIYPFGTAVDASATDANVRRLEKPIVHLDMNLGQLVVTVDMTPTFAKLRRQTNELAVLLFAMLGIVFATIALALEVAVRRPLSVLAEAARKLETDDYDAPLPGADGEVGTLVDSFASMRNELRRQKQALGEEHGRLLEQIRERELAQAEIRQLNQSLEQRVARRTAELQAANEDLEAFSYSVSHDLRAPLRAIHGFAQILLEEYQAKLDAAGQRYLGIVRTNAMRMDQLIDDILNFLHAGQLELTATPIDMVWLAQEAFDEILAATPGRKVRLEIGQLPPASGDLAMVRQVLVNLLANALKFTAKREEGVIEVRGRAGPKLNEYEVRDNGVGFDMQYAGKLFGVFERLHPADQFPGTGVGLSIVKRVVVRHGGDVRAEGKPGEGASVFFTLPRVPGA